MAKTSPTQRSKAHYEKLGYVVAIIEHWNPFAMIRQDMFGIIDLVVIGGSQTIGVQTTSYSNVPARVNKITASPMTRLLRDCNWQLVVHGWKKGKDGKWMVREVDLS